MFSLPYMRVLVPVGVLIFILALGAYVNLTLKQARYLYSGPVSISVVGIGEALAVPDVATFRFSVLAEAADATTAQNRSAESINTIVSYLEGEGIEEDDIQTEYYSLNPRYEYVESRQALCIEGGYCPPPIQGQRVLQGYEVNQTISVKVRDTEKAGELISGVGERGATNVSGVEFAIDDEEAIRAEARESAISDAQEKAEKLAEDLGVKIVRMTGYFEDQGGYPIYGYGGAEMDAAVSTRSVAPAIPVGENTVTVQVNISYEVR